MHAKAAQEVKIPKRNDLQQALVCFWWAGFWLPWLYYISQSFQMSGGYLLIYLQAPVTSDALQL